MPTLLDVREPDVQDTEFTPPESWDCKWPDHLGPLKQPLYVPMSLDEYLALECRTKVEWVDGTAIIGMAPNLRHEESSSALHYLLRRSLNNIWIGNALHIRNVKSYRQPDITVIDRKSNTDVTEELFDTALVLVEILSPSTKHTDLHEKVREYAAAGVGQYWIVDPVAKTIVVNENVAGSWQVLETLSSTNPSVTVEVPGHGTVPLLYSDIFQY